MFLKKLLVPFTNRMKHVDAVQTWEVRWKSRNGEYSGDVRTECEVFTEEQLATDFKKALENAFDLIRHTSGTKVSLQKRN